MAILLTSPTRKGRAPSFGSQHSSFRRPVSMCIRRGGPSELWRDSVAAREIVVEWFTAMLVRTPDPWPSLDSVIVDPDICIGSASQLEGEKNIDLPSVGSELHAAPSAPQNSSLSPSPPVLSPLGTPTCKNLLSGEGAATKQCATEVHHPKPRKPPDLHIEVLEKSGGVLSALGNAPVILEGRSWTPT